MFENIKRFKSFVDPNGTGAPRARPGRTTPGPIKPAATAYYVL